MTMDFSRRSLLQTVNNITI